MTAVVIACRLFPVVGLPIQSVTHGDIQRELWAAYVWSDLVLLASVREIAECPLTSKSLPPETSQRVGYLVESVAKGTVEDPHLRVAHPLAFGGNWVDASSSCLRRDFFHQGRRVALFLQRAPEGGDFVVYHQNNGVWPQDPEVLRFLEATRKACQSVTVAGVSTVAWRGSLVVAGLSEKERVLSIEAGGSAVTYDKALLETALGSDLEFRRVAMSPDLSYVAVEISNGYSGEVIVSRMGSACPPWMLTSRARSPDHSVLLDSHAGAASPQWLNDHVMAFIDSPDSFSGRDALYLYDLRSQTTTAYPLSAKPVDLKLTLHSLVCVLENGQEEDFMLGKLLGDG